MITAAELRAKQERYLQEVDDQQLQEIAARLEEAWYSPYRVICIEDINSTNQEKLRAAGYKVDFEPGDQRDPSCYYISW